MQNRKLFLGRGHCPSLESSPSGEGDTPSLHLTTSAPTTLQFSRATCSVLA